MKARMKSIAELFSTWRHAGGMYEPEEALECGIRQFGDGMGITSIMSYPDGDDVGEGDKQACAA